MFYCLISKEYVLSSITSVFTIRYLLWLPGDWRGWTALLAGHTHLTLPWWANWHLSVLHSLLSNVDLVLLTFLCWQWRTSPSSSSKTPRTMPWRAPSGATALQFSSSQPRRLLVSSALSELKPSTSKLLRYTPVLLGKRIQVPPGLESLLILVIILVRIVVIILEAVLQVCCTILQDVYVRFLVRY